MLVGSIFTILMYLICSCFAQEIVLPRPSSGPCRTASGTQGRCLEIWKCPSSAIGRRWTHCGFNGFIPVVCCPRSGDVTRPLTKLDEVAPPQTKFGRYKCGLRSFIVIAAATRRERSASNLHPVERSRDHKINRRQTTSDDGDDTCFESVLSIGGEISFRNSWPWLVLLGRKRGSSEQFFCGGTLINKNYVITAAHCVLDFEPFFVRFGEHDYSPDVGENLAEFIEDIDVADVIFHPKYVLGKGYHDIALLKLANRICFRKEVSPICLPWGSLANEDLIDEQVTLAGWGRKGFGGPVSTVLQEVNVTIFQPSVCVRSYSTLRDYNKKFSKGMNRENIICAGDVEGGKDSCEGDSGGPIMHYNREKDSFSLAGIISTGFGCGKKEFPGLYAPLRNYDTLQWIKTTAF